MVNTTSLLFWLQEFIRLLDNQKQDIEVNQGNILKLIPLLNNAEIKRTEISLEDEKLNLLKTMATLLGEELSMNIDGDLHIEVNRGLYLYWNSFAIGKILEGKSQIELFRYEVNETYVAQQKRSIRAMYESLSLKLHEKTIKELLILEYKHFKQNWSRSNHDTVGKALLDLSAAFFGILTKLDKWRLVWKEDFEEKEKELATLEEDLNKYMYETPLMVENIDSVKQKIREWFEHNGYLVTESKDVNKIN